MTTTTALQRAVELSSIAKLAAACDVTPGALRKWLTKNGLPMSDLTGETDYATRIAWEIQKYGGEFDALDLIRERLPDMKPGIVYRLPLELFTNDTNQPRKQFDTIKLEALALTLRHDGQETPIKVTVDMCAASNAERPLIITHGERRWRAAHIAQLTHLDCMLDTKADAESPADKIFRQAADNTGEQLSKWDWACTIRELSEQHGMTDSDISTELGLRGFDGFSRPVVANLRRLFKLPEEAQRLIECGWLTPSHGKYLLAIKHQPVLEGVVSYLTAHHHMDQDAPTISMLEIRVRNQYDITYPDPEDSWDDPETEWEYGSLLDEQVEAACEHCDHLYTVTLSNGYSSNYCTNLACYRQKQAEADQVMLARSYPETPGEPPISTAPAQNTQPEPTGPTLAATASTKSRQGAEAVVQLVDATRQMMLERHARLQQATRDSDRDTHLLILCMSAFCEDDDHRMTAERALARMKADPDEFIQAAAVAVLQYIDSDMLGDLRQHLNVTDVSRETDQHDLLESA